MRFLILFILTLQVHAACLNEQSVKTEKDKEIVFCTIDDLQLTKGCSEGVEKCSLLKDIKSKTPPDKVLKSSITGNPGSRICNSLGWKVHMASLFDESQVCTCLHPGGEYVTCSSLSDFYQNQTKDKK